jgi:acetyl esterase/lipase
VVAGGAELLTDDAQGLVAKARAAGVRASLVMGEDMVHGYAAFGGLTPRAAEAMRAIRNS